MKILIIGDVVARPGRKVLAEQLDLVRSQHDIAFTVVNIENAAGGFGITEKILNEFQSLDIDVLTSGNHIWDKREAIDFIDDHPTLLRPHNYPIGTPGSGWVETQSKSGISVGVLNIMGQAFMHPLLDSQYLAVDQVLAQKSPELKVILVDFHAETTSEKMALGWYLDGKVSAIVGTHTHVPTADERVLPKGTAYITDLGMTGCYDSVIGMDIDSVLKRAVEKMPSRFESATGPGSLCGVVVDIDEITGSARSIQRVRAELKI